MCYSALVTSQIRKLERRFGASADVNAYLALERQRMETGKVKIPKAMDDSLMELGGPLAEGVREWRDRQAGDLLRLRSEQEARLSNAQAKLQGKETKAALNDVRVATNKIGQFTTKLADLDRTEPKPRDSRIWPGDYASVVLIDGERLLRPMRYQCRMPGWNSEMEKQYPGTYNARRDKLDTSWKRLFGKQHAIMVVERFYESVDRDGKAVELEFTPSTGDTILVPCLWAYDAHDDLHSFAAITDDPEPEVAAAGHDRTIINIKPEHVDAWLNPQGDLAAMQYIFDDKRHPFYEHRLAA